MHVALLRFLPLACGFFFRSVQSITFHLLPAFLVPSFGFFFCSV
jgi:hypothetical protein